MDQTQSSELSEALQDELRASWQRYLDLLVPLRPALHGYCLRLTGNLWDAEDLVQESLVRAFATLGKLAQTVENPRAYLLRVATNAWIDTVRRRAGEADASAQIAAVPAVAPPPSGAVREAGTALLQRLAPRERAAVVLKDVFEMSLAEAADVLATTTGAVKAALHRGRGRLQESADAETLQRPAPPRPLVDAFVEAYNARDLQGLLALMLETAAVENVGCGIQTEHASWAGEQGFFHAAIYGHKEWPAELQYEETRMEVRVLDGEPLALGFVMRRGKEALEQVMRFDEREGRIARLHAYAFCPETMRCIGEALGVKVRTGLYRFPTPEPGKFYE